MSSNAIINDTQTASLLKTVTACDLTVTCPFRVVSRTLLLVSGDFVRSGNRAANEEWLLKRSISLVKGDKLKKRYHYLFKAKNILWHGAKNITKIATYPLATLAMVATDFQGLLSKDKERALRQRAKIEYAFSTDFKRFDALQPLTSSSETLENKTKVFRFHASEVLTPCKLEKEVKDQNNIYGLIYAYNRNTLRASLLRLVTIFKKNGSYFEIELKEHYLELKKLLMIIKQNVRLISDDNDDEIDEESGELRSFSSSFISLEKFRKAIWDLEISLIDIQKERLEKKEPNFGPFLKAKTSLFILWEDVEKMHASHLICR